MSKNKEYAKRLQELGKYKRGIIGYKLQDEEPKDIDSYGDDVSFFCATTNEVWERENPFYITKHNVLCGGNIYAGLGSQKRSKEDFDIGMQMTVGKNKAYETRQNMRRVNQQIPHFFKTHKYMILGLLEKVEDPDVVMIVTEPDKIMDLCKAYTWKTGELVQGMQGTAWCTQFFPFVYRNRTMSFGLGDPPSRRFMNLGSQEMYAMIHYDLLPLVIENLTNISSGETEYY